ncbi:hypothetical protein NEOLI_002879 [Neolecta irregularis DAH-3]|uniref:Uncharacterized protein n=1 Tax=Neolecta irregularis (strain DAH-3) TaxID=1198029 RepID=A0A1U7LSZ7_NEOID|nr:hypothetical protein NEOLI_002879 [Neolecta irregularis DAH-3]|eukprot:OLL25738.1 hypothetical protein NEOLI_002879 [Neolecta irregularis DAH-3]
MAAIAFRRSIYTVRTVKSETLNDCVPRCLSSAPKDADLMVLLYSHSLCRDMELSSLLQTFGARKTITAIVDDTILGNGCSILATKEEMFNVTLEKCTEQEIRVGRFWRIDRSGENPNLELGKTQSRVCNTTSVVLGQECLDQNSLGIVPAKTYFTFDRKHCISLGGKLLQSDECIRISLPGITGPVNRNSGLRKVGSPVTCFTAKGNILLTINNTDAIKWLLQHPEGYVSGWYVLINDDFAVSVLSGDPSRGIIALEGYNPKPSDHLQLCNFHKPEKADSLRAGSIFAATDVLPVEEGAVFGAVCVDGYWSRGVKCKIPGFISSLTLP